MSDIVTEFREILSVADNLVGSVSPFPRAEKTAHIAQVAAWRKMFESSCRLAVAGSANQGKSTLVNALLEHDWAAVGCTETTGTICVMTNKTALQATKPVRCVSRDGSGNCWVSVEEANAMQGHSREHLQRAQNICWLEYALGQLAPPFLADFELVDTPGTGAIVGTDGESHDRISLSFVKDVDALLLVTQDTLGELNKKILKAFHSNRRVDAQDSGAGVFIVCSHADLNCGSVEEMQARIQQKSEAVKQEAVENYRFPATTRVFCVSARLENILLQMGAGGMEDLYRKVHATCTDIDDLTEELEEEIIGIAGTSSVVDVILDAVFREKSPQAAADCLHKLAGVQELRKCITEEMKAKKLLFRMERMVEELLRYFLYDYPAGIRRYETILHEEQAAYRKFCHIVDVEPEFRRGQLGALLQAVQKNFSPIGVEEVERGRLLLVDKLQRLKTNGLELLRLRVDVYAYFEAHRSMFAAEAEEIEALCERNGRLFTPNMASVRKRRVYWLNKSKRMVDRRRSEFCMKVHDIYAKFVLLGGQ